MTIPNDIPHDEPADLIFHVAEGRLNISPDFAAAADLFCKKSGLDTPLDVRCTRG